MDRVASAERTPQPPEGGRERRLARRARSAAAVVAAGATLLGGCGANPVKESEADLTKLLAWLPGTYDNTAQADEDVRRGVRPPHDRIRLVIVRVYAPRLGKHVLYAQEMDPDDPNRVMSEHMLTFEVQEQGPKPGRPHGAASGAAPSGTATASGTAAPSGTGAAAGGPRRGDIVETVWTLLEPQRWRDGQTNPELFTAMEVEDAKKMTGCELVWVRSGDQFNGADDPKRCRGSVAGIEGATQVDLRAELTADTLALARNGTDGAGHLLVGRSDEPFNRFRKRD
jgi:CpeT/CpcT family (DUF1001)